MSDHSEIFSLSALEISKGLAAGKFTSEEVTAAYIDLIKEVDEKVHAFLSYDENDMLEQAKASDNRRSEDKTLGPLGPYKNYENNNIRTTRYR